MTDIAAQLQSQPLHVVAPAIALTVLWWAGSIWIAWRNIDRVPRWCMVFLAGSALFAASVELVTQLL